MRTVSSIKVKQTPVVVMGDSAVRLCLHDGGYVSVHALKINLPKTFSYLL